MKVTAPGLAPILRSDTQGRLLAEILTDPDREHSVSALAEHVGTSLPTAIREVDRAEDAALVRTRRVGKARLVRANPDHPLYEPFRQIILATYGAPAVVAEVLQGVEGVREVYIFGSWAARYVGERGRGPNDIDVLVVGDVDREAVYSAGERIEERLRFPVQVTIRTPAEWSAKQDPFLVELDRRPLVRVSLGA